MTNDGLTGLKTLAYCLPQLTVIIYANELNTVFPFRLSIALFSGRGDLTLQRPGTTRLIERFVFLYHFLRVIECQKSNGYTYIIRIIIVVFDRHTATARSRVGLRSFASRNEGYSIPPFGSCVHKYQYAQIAGIGRRGDKRSRFLKYALFFYR